MIETPKEKVLNSLMFLSNDELREINQKINTLLNSNVSPVDEMKNYFRNMKNFGEPIEAIKQYQKKTGCSLAEAKDFIDGL